MRQDAAAEFREAQANERARQLRKEQDERDHEAWKRQLLRDRNVTIHASTSSSTTDVATAALVTYTVMGGGGGQGSQPISWSDCSKHDSGSFDSSSSSSSDSSSGGGGD